MDRGSGIIRSRPSIGAAPGTRRLGSQHCASGCGGWFVVVVVRSPTLLHVTPYICHRARQGGGQCAVTTKFPARSVVRASPLTRIRTVHGPWAPCPYVVENFLRPTLFDPRSTNTCKSSQGASVVEYPCTRPPSRPSFAILVAVRQGRGPCRLHVGRPRRAGGQKPKIMWLRLGTGSTCLSPKKQATVL